MTVSGPENVGPSTLLGVCSSLKPAPGRSGQSAVRSLVGHALEAVSQVYSDVSLLDLRDHRLPFFDGRMAAELNHPAVALALSAVEGAGALLLGIPGYWSGVSGVFKNFVDVLCGPAYDIAGEQTTVFTGKSVGLVVVGADARSTKAAVLQAVEIMTSVGARLVEPVVSLSDPRSREVDEARLSRDLVVLGGELARRCYSPSLGHR